MRLGRLHGIGLGPGDPELLTVKAVKLLRSAPVVSYFAKAGRCGIARTIATPWLSAERVDEPLYYPMTTETRFDHADYLSGLGAFYTEATDRLAAHLDAGRDVALLCEGDPLFYGSFMHLYVRLRGRYEVSIVPGVTGMSGCWAAAGEPMTWGDDVMTVLPGTLDAGRLREHMAATDALVVMKIGQNLGKVRAALEATGLFDRALYIERGTMAEERVMRLADKPGDDAPYFAIVLVPGAGTAAVIGALTVVGLGPGPACWLTPEAEAALADATDLVGYTPYVARVPARPGLVRHPSDNRVELDRARLAFRLAAAGRGVAVVSGGDPGVFAMAAAVVEALEADPSFAAVPLRILPGITAMQAAAARLGAPLGHDFCAISLSDNLKPWEVVLRRLKAAADGDFVVALYNPASRARPGRLGEAFDALRDLKQATTPLAFARAIGRPDERIHLTTLGEADATLADMATLVVIGSSETRYVEGGDGRHWMLTPRSYGQGGRP